MYQTHSINIQKVDVSDAKKGLNEFKDGVYDVDIYTYEPNLVLCSLHADCFLFSSMIKKRNLLVLFMLAE